MKHCDSDRGCSNRRRSAGIAVLVVFQGRPWRTDVAQELSLGYLSCRSLGGETKLLPWANASRRDSYSDGPQINRLAYLPTETAVSPNNKDHGRLVIENGDPH